MRGWGVVSLMIVLAGCARTYIPPPAPDQTAQQPSNDDAEIIAQNKVALQQLASDCAASMQAPTLDPIRDKVELAKRPNVPTPFAILTNNNYPTAAEEKVIAVWGTLLDRCQRNVLAWQQTRSLPSIISPALANHIQRFDTLGLRLANELRALLYVGKLTYSEYAKARQTLMDNEYQALQQYYAAVQADDAQAMAAIDAAYEKGAMAAEAYMQTAMNSAGAARPRAAPAGGRGMLAPPPVGANAPKPPADANGMLQPPAVGANQPPPPAGANGMMAPPSLDGNSQ